MACLWTLSACAAAQGTNLVASSGRLGGLEYELRQEVPDDPSACFLPSDGSTRCVDVNPEESINATVITLPSDPQPVIVGVLGDGWSKGRFDGAWRQESAAGSDGSTLFVAEPRVGDLPTVVELDLIDVSGAKNRVTFAVGEEPPNAEGSTETTSMAGE